MMMSSRTQLVTPFFWLGKKCYRKTGRSFVSLHLFLFYNSRYKTAITVFTSCSVQLFITFSCYFLSNFQPRRPFSSSPKSNHRSEMSTFLN